MIRRLEELHEEALRSVRRNTETRADVSRLELGRRYYFSLPSRRST